MRQILRDYITLCKPNVVLLMLLTSWVGMTLASPQNINNNLNIFIFASIGIGCAASSAAVINHLLDRNIDAHMQRTSRRPIACGRISPKKAIIFSVILSTISMLILYLLVNPITTLLTFMTILGYAFIYTLFLKRATPQNIVIGGIAGATPPLLGWSSVSNDISAQALLLVLIIFVWTPPHFWALAIYRLEDYKKANIPMLPVTHGLKFTKLCILLYTILLSVITLFPFLIKMSGFIYLISSIGLNIMFIFYSIKLYFSKNNIIALETFNFSIVYLLLLFVILLCDHYYYLN